MTAVRADGALVGAGAGEGGVRGEAAVGAGTDDDGGVRGRGPGRGRDRRRLRRADRGRCSVGVTFPLLVNLVLNGLVLGTLYFLLASGLSLIFGVMSVLN